MMSQIIKNINIFENSKILQALKIAKKVYDFKRITTNISLNNSNEQEKISMKEKKLIKDCIVKDRIKKNKNKMINKNKTDTMQKMKEFKKKLLTIEYKFTSYI